LCVAGILVTLALSASTQDLALC